MFPTSDAISSYEPTGLDEKDISIAAFVTNFGHIKYTRMPFGLKYAPAMFPGAVSVMPVTVKWQHRITYIDDLVNFSFGNEKNILSIQKVLLLLKNAEKTKIWKVHVL